MPAIASRLQRLEKKLAGFVAGILFCPDLIVPSDGLPLVWGSDEDDAPVFENAQQAEHFVTLVMEHYAVTD